MGLFDMHQVFYQQYQIHAVGGVLLVDSTFAPPPLQFPFKWGADIVMHSGTNDIDQSLTQTHMADLA
jgi:cystathionine beta-lyase/cystathionine gamma-synthase